MSHKILIAGATGLIGQKTVELAIADATISKIIVPVRKPVAQNDKLEQWIDADITKALRSHPVDAVICCLGTTIRTAGSKAAFRKVDHDLVLDLAKWSIVNGAKSFSVISSMGADPNSMFFYNKVKGATERDLKALNLPALHIFRPSLLIGPRDEDRIGERIAVVAMKAVKPLVPTTYKPMPHDILAKALLKGGTLTTSGGPYTYKEILELALG